jgi:hypothetical protein
MNKLLLLLCFWPPLAAASDVLVVADEFPAMEVLARHLKAGAGVASTIVKQDAIPSDTARFSSLVVYIHRTITEPAEKAFIDYANNGGRLILLHHSISSGKRGNRWWFPFLGISLPAQEFAQGGYKYFEGIRMEIVNLAPKEYITTHRVKYPARIEYRSSDLGSAERARPGFALDDTEVYLNHVFSGERKILLGLKYHEPQSGRTYMQDRAGWYKRAGKGWVLYFMPGHSVKEFENPVYSQILVNAVTAKLAE